MFCIISFHFTPNGGKSLDGPGATPSEYTETKYEPFDLDPPGVKQRPTWIYANEGKHVYHQLLFTFCMIIPNHSV